VIEPWASYCNIPELLRTTCGSDAGETEATCLSRGCCWREPYFSGVPWCYCADLTTTTTTSPSICSTHYYPVDSSSAYCQVDTADREECGDESITESQCEEVLGCCWDANASSGCYCPRPNPAAGYDADCTAEADYFALQVLLLFPSDVCSTLPLITTAALGLSNKWASNFAYVANVFPLQADSAGVTDADRAASCTDKINRLFRVIIFKWKFSGLFYFATTDCEEDFGDLVSAWANASSAWQEVFLPYGDNATAVDAAADASGTFAATFVEAGETWSYRAEGSSCSRVPDWAGVFKTIIESGSKVARDWAAYGNTFAGLELAKTRMVFQWSQSFKLVANEISEVGLEWADECESSTAIDAEVASNASAACLGHFSEEVENVLTQWVNTYTAIDGDCLSNVCLHQLRRASTLWSTLNFYTGFGEVAQVWAGVFTTQFPASSLAPSAKWAQVYETFGASLFASSAAFSGAFGVSTASLWPKGWRARDAANMWAAEFSELGHDFPDAWGALASGANVAIWNEAMRSIGADLGRAARAWAGVFAGTVFQPGLEGAGVKWAVTLEEHCEHLFSFGQVQAAQLGGTAASFRWARTWQLLALESRITGRAFAQQFDPWSAANPLFMVPRIRAVSDQFELVLTGLATRIKDNGLQFGFAPARSRWEDAALVVENAADGSNPTSTAWAFKSVLDISMPPGSWTDTSGWNQTYTDIKLVVDTFLAAFP